MGVILAIGLIFAAGFAAPLLHRLVGERVGLLLALFPAGSFLYFLSLRESVASDGAVRVVYSWLPSFGIDLSFYVDGLSLLFLLVISGVGVFIVLYAAGYLHGSKKLGKFYLYLLGFMGSMLGVVAADNLIVLFIFWELTSITSYLLIGYYHDSEESRKSALQALLVTGGGGLCLMAGLILLGLSAGTFSLSEILASGYLLEGSANWSTAIFILLILGAFTKSAQFPFHFWLPNAMAAPAPVSAFLHSATMVKAGVFLLARLFPVLAAHPAWTPTLCLFGGLTMLTGVFLGLGHRDLKKILAYTTLSVLGTLVLLLGLGTELGVKAAMVFLLAHALYKAALFMTAGIVDHETGTRDVDAVGGLRHNLPFTATAALVGALSMAGIPILFGFLGKEYLYIALLDGGPWRFIGVLAAFAAAAATFALAFLSGIKPFWGTVRETPKPPHEAPWTMWIGPLLLGVASLLFGIAPGLADRMVLSVASMGTLHIEQALAPVKLPNPLQPNLALILSLLTFVAGWFVWRRSKRIRDQEWLYQRLAASGPNQGYFKALYGLIDFASWQTRVLQNGYLRIYLMTIVGFAGILLIIQLFRVSIFPEFDQLSPIGPLEIAAAILAIGGSLVTAISRDRLTAIIAMGSVGMAIAFFFFIYGAPDLAMTQFLVETLTVLMLVLALYKLPQFFVYSQRASRVRDVSFCLIFGVVVASLVLVANRFQLQEPISEYFLANSYELAHGRNIVNVILVDFRALDTLGEIAVLAIAALGVYSMLKLRPSQPRRIVQERSDS